jgi:serine/threonine protein phosphatase PrpC
MVPDAKLNGILGNSSDLEVVVKELIDSANAAGGVDNVTAILARVSPG